jgi:hypothetical protein
MADIPPPSDSQDSPAELDLEKLARILALVDSGHDAEALAALRAGCRLLRKSGLTLADLLKQHSLALQAASLLLSESNALKAELEQARASLSTASTVVAVWQDTRAQAGSPKSIANWVLDLHRQGRVYLSEGFEVDFMRTCSKWKGRLTAQQQPIFARIIERVIECTGLTPPA